MYTIRVGFRLILFTVRGEEGYQLHHPKPNKLILLVISMWVNHTYVIINLTAFLRDPETSSFTISIDYIPQLSD